MSFGCFLAKSNPAFLFLNVTSCFHLVSTFSIYIHCLVVVYTWGEVVILSVESLLTLYPNMFRSVSN